MDNAWNAVDAYSDLDKAGALADLKRHAIMHRASLQPVDRTWLKKRLSAMMLAFGHERDPERVAAWLAETGRLLIDLPGEILATSIDEAIKRSERGFIPAVGQIRAIAEPMLEKREREVHRLETLAGLVAAGGPRRPRPWEDVDTFDPATRCSPDAATAILEEFGLRSTAKPAADRHLGPPRAPTVAEMGEVMRAVGITPGSDDVPVADIKGLSIPEILEQAARLKTERLARNEAAERQERQRKEAHRRTGAGAIDDVEDYERYFG